MHDICQRLDVGNVGIQFMPQVELAGGGNDQVGFNIGYGPQHLQQANSVGSAAGAGDCNDQPLGS